MTAALIIAVAAGVSAALLGRETRRAAIAGEAILFAVALAAGSLFLLAIVGVQWSFATAIALLTSVAATLAFVAWRRGNRLPLTKPRLTLATLFDAGSAATLAGYTLFATAGPLAEIDFIASWGLKARTYFHARGFDWILLENPWYRWTHADYPPLLPLSFDWIALASGQWNDRWIGLLYPAFALALLLIVRSLLAEELGSETVAAAASLALLPLMTSPWVGNAEGPLVAYGTAGVLLMRRALREPARATWPAAVFLGCAAMTKNEGMALLVATTIALLALPRARRLAIRLWPAWLIALTWIAMRAVHHLPTDLARAGAAGRIAERLRDPLPYIQLLAKYASGTPLLWIGVLLAFILTMRRMLREEALVLITVALMLAFDFVAFLSTPQSTEWLIRWSWERLVSQVVVMIAFVCVVQVVFVMQERGIDETELPSVDR